MHSNINEFPSNQNWFQRPKYLTELEKLWEAKPPRCSAYEQICISSILRPMNNPSHCQKTTWGYRLPEKLPLVCISQSCTSTMLIFGNNDILGLVQKSQISISVAAEIIAQFFFSMKQEILSAIHWNNVWDPDKSQLRITSYRLQKTSKRAKDTLPSRMEGSGVCFILVKLYTFYLNLSLF